MILFGQYTTSQREEALEDAERRLDTKGHTPTVELPVKKVKTLPVLFQPREFIGVDAKNNRATVDEQHVKSLKRAVEIYGELEAPLVIKLDTGFVIVDGHHTLEAYKEAKKTEVKCKWFLGTVREAMDESMRRNGKDKKALRQAERMQEGWKRVLLSNGREHAPRWTAKQIEDVCGVSVRQVKEMRSVVRRAEEKSKYGRGFRDRLKEYTKHCGVEATPLERLKEISWQVAKAIRRNASPEEATAEEAAAALSMALTNKMERRLSVEPHVTALALRLYDKNLPKKLMTEWAAMETVDPVVIEEARREWEKRAEAARDRGRRAARTRAKQEAEAAVAKAANARIYAKEPEEQRVAEERFKKAQEALRALKAAQEAAVEAEATARGWGRAGRLAGGGGR
jgi:ParB-like nuclease domain